MSFREVGREEPQSSSVRTAALDISAIDSAPAVPMFRFREPIRGAEDFDGLLAAMDPKDLQRMELMDEKDIAQAARFSATIDKAIETVMNATAERRVAAMIERAAAMLCASLRGQTTLFSYIAAFATEAGECISLGDYRRLSSAITAFDRNARDAAAMAPPKPPLMPAVYNAGWSSQEEIGLRNILLKGLCGVAIGDRCISIDAAEAKLASGKRISKKDAREAGPSMESRMTMVGSLPAVLAAIQRGKAQS